MRHSRNTVIFLAVALCALCGVFASGADTDSIGNEVAIHFARGDAQIMTVQKGTRVFTNAKNELVDYPAELEGLSFTQRKVNDGVNVTIDVRAGTTVYAMFGSHDGAKGARDSAEIDGWARIEDAHLNPKNPGPLAVYKKVFSHAERLTLIGEGTCDIIVCKQAKLVESFGDNGSAHSSPSAPGQPTPDETRQGPFATRIDVPGGPTTQITRLQSSIEALYVLTESTGEHLGLASRLILTATPSDAKEKDRDNFFEVEFTSDAGGDMHAALEDVNRALRAQYHVHGIKKVELSFEDKFSPKDGGSIGAAIGTLLLSMIDGFEVDPNLAITGDVTADGRLRAIGAVAAKIRGAIKSGCKIVAVPTENLEQVQDAIVYDGPGGAINAQIIGVGSLDEAAGVARVDRDSKLAQALSTFSQIQTSIKADPQYVFTTQAQETLKQVLKLEPNHYSASLLLAYSQRQLPHLSAAATEYYISVAVKEFWDTPALNSRTADFSAEDALTKLAKLRPLSDLTVRAYLDAWAGYVRLYTRARAGEHVTSQDMDDQFQQVLNEGAKLDTNRELSEKLLHEGI